MPIIIAYLVPPHHIYIYINPNNDDDEEVCTNANHTTKLKYKKKDDIL